MKIIAAAQVDLWHMFSVHSHWITEWQAGWIQYRSITEISTESRKSGLISQISAKAHHWLTDKLLLLFHQINKNNFATNKA